MRQGSSVSIVTRMRVERGSYRGKGTRFCRGLCGPALKYTKPSAQWVDGDSFVAAKAFGRETNN